MKILKVLFIFALVSMIAVSCKETKKEDIQDDSAVEMTEEGSTMSGDMEATEEGSEEVEGAAASMKKVEAIEGVTEGLEEMVVPEGVIAEEMADTPVIYPGCEGATEEVRACSREKFIAFLKREFDTGLASDLNLKDGDYKINSIVQIDEKGKCIALRIDGPSEALKNEMKRVIDKLPMLTPATHEGKPVKVSFAVPVDFKVKS